MKGRAHSLPINIGTRGRLCLSCNNPTLHSFHSDHSAQVPPLPYTAIKMSWQSHLAPTLLRLSSERTIRSVQINGSRGQSSR